MTVAKTSDHTVLKSRQLGQLVGGDDKGLGNVDPVNPAVEAVCKIPRRSTDTAPDIDQMVAGLYWETIGKFPCRQKPAGMSGSATW